MCILIKINSQDSAINDLLLCAPTQVDHRPHSPHPIFVPSIITQVGQPTLQLFSVEGEEVLQLRGPAQEG